MNWLQLLQQLMRGRNRPAQQQPSAHFNSLTAGPSSGYTPETLQTLSQLLQSYMNPGGGKMGNDTVGGGQVFGGFQRNGQPVGDVGWLSKGAPQPYQQSQIGRSMQPSWGAQNWLQQFAGSMGKDYLPYGTNSFNPSGASGGGGLGGMLFGEQPGAEFHGGGPGMMEFLNRGNSLQSMDDAFLGIGTGGGEGRGFMNDLYF